MHRFADWPLGIKIAAAALVVNTVRYVLVFLMVDGLRFHPAVEGLLLAVSAIATGIVLTGGGVYVAHALSVAHGHQVARALLVVAWLLLLLFTVVLLSPALVLGIRATDMAKVIAPPLDWLWAIVAVSAVEVLAGASVLAHALTLSPLPAHNPTQSATAPPLSAAPTTKEGAPSQTEPPQSAPLPPLELTPVALKCDGCQREFGTPNALRAHKRFCAPAPTVVTTNGHA